MKIYLKNMVCDRCKLVVNDILNQLSWPAVAVQLGEVNLGDFQPDDTALAQFRQKVEAVGFEVDSDRKTRLIEGVRTSLRHLVENAEHQKVKLSEYLAKTHQHEYSYISQLFSSVEGLTIEQAFILQKIEKAKELLVYDELTLTEIAHRLGYSSVAHLSRQFKQVTGLTPTAFRQMREAGLRVPLDQI